MGLYKHTCLWNTYMHTCIHTYRHEILKTNLQKIKLMLFLDVVFIALFFFIIFGIFQMLYDYLYCIYTKNDTYVKNIIHVWGKQHNYKIFWFDFWIWIKNLHSICTFTIPLFITDISLQDNWWVTSEIHFLSFILDGKILIFTEIWQTL